jgi:hypothetical protein
MTAWVQNVDKWDVSNIGPFHTRFMHRPYTRYPVLPQGHFSLKLKRLASYPKVRAVLITTTILDKT